MSEPEFFEATVVEYSIGDKALYLQGVKRGEKNEQERIIKLIEAEIERVSNPMLVDREYLDGLEVALGLIKGDMNE